MSEAIVIDFERPLTTLIDNTGTYKYIGEAKPGRNTAGGTASTVWRVSRVTLSTGSIEYAGGGEFSQIWDNRASLTYG